MPVIQPPPISMQLRDEIHKGDKMLPKFFREKTLVHVRTTVSQNEWLSGLIECDGNSEIAQSK